MKRPWRRVVRSEDVYVEIPVFDRFHRIRSDGGDLVLMRRIHLACGHFVERKHGGFVPERIKCHICQGKKVSKFQIM